MRRFGWVEVLILMVGLLGGCALPSVTPKPVEMVLNPIDDIESWWYVRFRLMWPEGENAPWWPDLLLADRVLGPILDNESAELSLWRFHRRAARDEAGRQFTFIFRAKAAVAMRINARIAADPLLIQLLRTGTVQSVNYEDPSYPQRLGVGDTSDKRWSPDMQVVWPYFIMGVSRFWLELIREIQKTGEWPETPKARYIALSEAIDMRWRDEGGHALLHHLSAVFGYQELLVAPRKLVRF